MLPGQLIVHDWKHILKAFLCSLGASALLFILTLLPAVHVPTQYLVFWTGVSPFLTSVITALVHFLQDRSNIVESL